MLSYESFSIPADRPEPVVQTSLLALLWRQQQQQQQSFAAIADRLLPTTHTPVPHDRYSSSSSSSRSNSDCLTTPSPTSTTDTCSLLSSGMASPSSPASDLEQQQQQQVQVPVKDQLVALEMAAGHVTQPLRKTGRAGTVPRKGSLRGLQALAAQHAPEDLHKVLDACQIKKLQKAERKKLREMNRKLVCFNCGATSSPIWRRTLDRKNNICNACGLYFKNHKHHKPIKPTTTTTTTTTAPIVASPASVSSPAEDDLDEPAKTEGSSDSFLDDFLNFDDGCAGNSHDPVLSSAGSAGQDCFTIPHAEEHLAQALSLQIHHLLQQQPHVQQQHLPTVFPPEYSDSGMDIGFGDLLWSSQDC
ncbi:hypothetical protein HDU78_009563 [Chytriomyces hyalinus]|nr:hypothetical protein HDU78_009563 [Chytriomyces hyalinus]